MTPPKPASRPDRVSLWRYFRLFRSDILSAQPERLYRAWMAEFRTPFFRSFMVNDPDLIRQVLRDRPGDFPKADRISEGLRPLLGRSVFVTNGPEWQRQRRIIDPAFEGGRLRDTFDAMLAAARGMSDRLETGEVEIEGAASHATADVIFRTLFSIPIDHRIAAEVFDKFQAYQRSQPLINLGALFRLPAFVPRLHRRRTRLAARHIRDLLARLTRDRLAELAAGTAPPDLATKILTTRDPVTGGKFDESEMIDQIAIFFLAGHETSASALGWALYLLARDPDWQTRLASEAQDFMAEPTFARLSTLKLTRDVFREALRLYPPVPMMVREVARRDESLRGRAARLGDLVVLSPWHLHRHTRLWDQPNEFAPGRWETDNGRARQRDSFYPFSAGSRVCPGAGFAMVEGVVLIAAILATWRVEPVAGHVPVPQAHLTVRSKNGIWLRFERR